MNIVDELARRYLRAKGYYVPGVKNQNDEYTLFKYTRPDGSFDYEKYRIIQEDGNKRKINNVWADEETIKFISNYLNKTNSSQNRGICHGVRRGLEQQWFSETLGVDAIGTDISETATRFPNTVQWDFHEEKPEWVGAFDFVYTNSHDHAYDPKKALDTWVRQLKPGGAVVLEHTPGHTPSGTSQLDPFGVDAKIFPYLIAKWGAGEYAVMEILEPPHTKPQGLKIWIFIIRKTRNA